MSTLTGNKIKDTYYKVVQVDNGMLMQNGLGSPLTGSIKLSGSLHVTGSQTVAGDLRVFGNVTAKQFIATTVSSSVIYESGSSEFGNSIDDTHTFTGSLYISNSIDLTGDQTITGTLTLGDYTDVSASLKQAEDDIIANSASAHVARGQLSASAHLSRTQLSSSADVARVALSSSAHTARRSEIGDLSGSAHTARRSEISDLSGSAHDQRLAISSSTATNIRAEITALSASVDEVSDAEHASRVAELNDSSSALTTAFTNADTALSSSAHDQRVALIAGTASDITALSSSAHTARINLSSSVDTHIDAKLAGLVDSAPATLDTLNELAAALGDDPNVSASFATTLGTKFATADHNTYSGSASSAFRAEYVAGDTELSGALNTRIEALEAGGGTSGLSASAHTQRTALSASSAIAFRTEYTDGDVALTSTLNNYTASTDTRLDSIEASTSSYVTNSQTSSMTVLSSSYALTASHALNIPATASYAISGSYALTASHALNIPATASFAISASYATSASYEITYEVSSSYAETATSASYATTASYALNVPTGAGFPYTGSAEISGSLDVIDGVITGDGSGLTNLTFDQAATVVSSFTSVTTASATHNFGTKNVIAFVYDNSDNQILPAELTTTDSNTVTVTFDSATSGRLVVARGGHIVSGSIEYNNILNKPDLETSASVAADYISIERLKALVAAAPTYNDFTASIAAL